MAEQPGRYHAGMPAALLNSGSSSFTEFLTRYAPDLLPSAPAVAPTDETPGHVHGTTVLALVFPGGVVAAADRRGTMGNYIASRQMRKLYLVDEYTVVGFAGAAGTGVQFIRLFQVELEHYEKIEGSMLSYEAKINRLGSMLRENIGMAMQGFAHVPLIAGYDRDGERGRIVTYDVIGSVSEARDHDAIGSGSRSALSALKKLYRADFTEAEAVRAAVEALYDAADDDTATVGPDLTRRIYPIVSVATPEGARELPEDQIAAVSAEVVAGRLERPNGPTQI